MRYHKFQNLVFFYKNTTNIDYKTGSLSLGLNHAF
ncbi:hypothetical protein SAMN05421593_1492 [Chryseobacterium culicis]|uniref:Uncharacterized protein n=1 Tax=Chryseobacterium culicis TaxID=680127 RepID=A0A1H6HBE6_CHRCI|nr:hypothetical protein SAMN05421593_1492 [Chryseobacterium culicis]